MEKAAAREVAAARFSNEFEVLSVVWALKEPDDGMLDPTTCVCDNDDVESCDAVPEALEQPKALQPSEAGRYRAWRAAAAAAIIADDMMMEETCL